MEDQRQSFNITGDTANLQQEVIPSPLPTATEMGAPPVIPRSSSSPYQSASFASNNLMPYGMNPFGMNQNFGYANVLPGYGNSLLPSTIPSNVSTFEVENVSRSIFETLGSVVQTFGSVSVMLQSTLFALQNSVHAIVSVANQLGHMRNHIVQLCVAALRMIRHYYRRLMHLFYVDRRAASVETLWADAVQDSSGNDERHRLLLFFAVVFGMPYLMWGLIKKILQSNTSTWKGGIGEHFKARVKFPYTASQADELSVTAEEILFVAPKHKQPVIKGWILASNGDKVGLVPANYIEIQSKVEQTLSKKDDISNEVPTSSKNTEIDR